MNVSSRKTRTRTHSNDRTFALRSRYTPKLLAVQVFKELFFVYVLILGSLLSLILIGRMLQLRELFLTQSLGILDITSLFLYLTPLFLLVLMPVACMLSVFVTFLRMSNERELVALRAGGISLYQMLPAPLAFCLLCTAANFIVSFYGVAWGMDHFRASVLDFAKTRTQLIMQAGVFNQEFPGLTIFAQNVDAKKGEMDTVFVQDKTKPEIEGTILAPSGKVITDSEHGEILILFQNGQIYRLEKNAVSVLQFDTYTVRLDLSKLLKGYDMGEPRPKEMSMGRLNALRHDPKTANNENPRYYRKIIVEQHKRFALPLACLALGMFALPFACAFQGLKQSYGLMLTVLFFLVYYTLLSLGISLGETGRVPPFIGLWLPDVLFGLLATMGTRLVAHERRFNLSGVIRFSHLLQRGSA